ncbi:hypothetical protein PMAYCL1PPCAC_32416, partial [Pristionchus mayeri]
SELVGHLVAEHETLVTGGGIVTDSALAAGGVVSALRGAEVHLWERIEGALISTDEHLLEQRLVVGSVVTAGLTGS